MASSLCRTVALIALLARPTGPVRAEDRWTQWGGEGRDFRCADAKLADSWPAAGPRKLWSREIGPGHSAIVADADAIYTMCRRGEQDAVLALAASDGKPLWETRYDSPTKPDMQLEFGPGPHSTPLLAGDRLIAISSTVLVHCLNRKTGEIVWKQDLEQTVGAAHPQRGYAASPLVYEDTVIIPAGGKDTGVVALRIADGQLAWKTPPFRPTMSSPILAKIHGEDHLILAMGTDRVGLNPKNGDVRWRETVDQQAAAIISTPLFVEPDKVAFSSAYGGGTYLFQIERSGDAFSARQLWHAPQFKVHHQSFVRVGELLVGSSGDFGPAFLMGVHLADGKVAWRERGLPKVNFVCAGDKLLLLDEEGTLGLARAGETKIDVLAKAKLLEDKAWTVPTLVGARAYLRDNKTVMAVELGL
jgi:outer membrane protein assembly factor BamB